MGKCKTGQLSDELKIKKFKPDSIQKQIPFNLLHIDLIRKFSRLKKYDRKIF